MFVHDGRSNFFQQDMLVPWHIKNNSNKLALESQFLRYYHLFVKDELIKLIEELPQCQIIHLEYEEGNWAVIFKKIKL